MLTRHCDKQIRGLVVAALLGGCGRIGFGDRPSDHAPFDGNVIGDIIGDVASGPDSDRGVLACDGTNPDLVGCWAFENNTLDGSQYHNDATQTDVAFAIGYDGLSATTDAQTELLIASSPSLSVTTTFTVEAWIFLTAYPVGAAEFIFDDDNEYTLMVLGGGVIGANVGAAQSTLVQTAQSVSLNAWHHVSFRFDMSTTLDVVIDGAIAGSTPASGPVIGVGTAGSRIAGDAGVAATPPFIGMIDDVRVWRVVRNVADL